MDKQKKLEELLTKVQKIGVTTERDNANVGNNFSAKLLQIASAANKTANILSMPEDIVEAYEKGYLHYHDYDAYNLTINCLQIDTGDLLKRGFNTGYGTINPPKRIDSAASLSCIIMQSCQNDMFGGVSHYNFDNDLAPYVVETENEIIKNMDILLDSLGITAVNKKQYDEIVRKELLKQVHQAMQIIVYNLNTMHYRAGSQVPFSTLNLGVPLTPEAALVCEVFLKEYNKGLGKSEQPVFPNIVFRVKDGVNLNPQDPYYYLFELACKVASNRMNPTFLNCDADFNKALYEKGVLPATMGCRTSLYGNVNGEATPKSRGNIAPVSINLPMLALEVDEETTYRGGMMQLFYRKLDYILDICEKQLMHRYNILKDLRGKDLPFVVLENVYMNSELVGPEDSIEPLLKVGTYSIGFIGLAEAIKVLTDFHHGESGRSYDEALRLVEYIRHFCDRLTKKYNLNFTCYATPAEGLTGRFAKINKQRFGIIEGITDKDYLTNSFHIPVDFNISIAKKLKLEAPFHKLCNAGHISYVELDRAPVDDETVVLRIVKYAFTKTNAGYIGINFGIRYCRDCGCNHIEGNECPNCKSKNIQGISRVTGYLSLDERFTEGKAAEKKARVSHK